MELSKAQWQTNGDRITVNMPFSKVDVEKRMVSGWATLDNVDSQGDKVEASASARAFTRFRGNIREMHQPIAAGRLVKFEEDEFFHTESGKTLRGVRVQAYVSKGAQATWEKVLDGTLQGFSIGGNIIDASTEFDKSSSRDVRIIKDYDLVELSLVDSPANPLANVFSIEKSEQGSFVKGMIADANVENVFWCVQDEIAKSVAAESYNCPACSSAMQTIGWFDTDIDKYEKVAEVVEKFKKQAQSAYEGGATNMENDENASESVETEGSKASVEIVYKSEEVVANNEVEEPDLQKMFGDLNDTIKKSQEQTAESLGDLETRLARALDANDSVQAKVEGLMSEHKQLVEKFDSVTKQLGKVEKGLEALEGSTALRKSADLGGSAEAPVIIEKSLWSGSVFSLDD
jgi:Caudovirus prohead serine protease